MLDIRFATIADIPVIQELTARIWPATYCNILSVEQISYMLDKMYSTGSLQQQMRAEGHEFIVLYIDDFPAAFASYSREDEQTWKLHKIYVLPGLHGNGVGKKLLNFIITEIKKKGAQTLLLNVNRYNSAKSFYEKLGFMVLGEEDIDIGGGYFMNDYVMNLVL